MGDSTGNTTAPIPESRQDTDPEHDLEWVVIPMYLSDGVQHVGARRSLSVGERFTFGRNPQCTFHLLRPQQGRVDIGPITTPTLGRAEFDVVVHQNFVIIEAVGRHRIRVNGKPVLPNQVQPAAMEFSKDPAIVAVEREAIFLITKRPRFLPKLRHFPMSLAGDFGRRNRLAMVGESHVFWEMMEALALAAAITDKACILLSGESGTGKQPAARAIHALSRYADGPFKQENCANLQATVADLLLFGGLKGWLAGIAASPGWFSAARGGVLFLDEFGDLLREVQTMLLNVLQERQYTQKGSTAPIPLECLVIGATNKPLTDPPLRQDLVYRTHIVRIPSLMERIEDIPLLARDIIRFAEAAGDPRVRDLHNLPHILEHLLVEGLKGNMRGLQDAVLDGLVDLKKVIPGAGSPSMPPPAAAFVPSQDRPVRGRPTLPDTLEMINDVRVRLRTTRWNVSEVARQLGVDRSAVREFMARNEIPTKPADGDR